MKPYKRIHAFTLPEITVVLAIASFVILTAYSVYYIIHIHFENYRKCTIEYLQVHELSKVLTLDFYTSNEVILEDNRITFASPYKTKEYQLHQNMVIRKETPVIDTFKIHLADFAAARQHSPVQDGLIDFLKIDFLFADQQYSLTFQKDYSSEVLFNFPSLNSSPPSL